MATIYTRAAKGSALTWTEGDANITNLNNAKLENVVEDTTPQLGGNLDVNGNSIVSTSNGNINLTPNGTGKVVTTAQLDANILRSTQSAGDEGGEVQLALAATNTTLSGSVAIDINQNRLRIFETGGSNRGAYIDLSSAATGVGTNLVSSGGMTSFTVAGDSGTSQTIENGNTLTISGGTGLSAVASATDTITINLDNTAVTAGTYTLPTAVSIDAQGRITAASNASTTGSGVVVLATSPTLTTPNIGAATGTSLTTTGGGVVARQASTQDGIEIRGRAGGTGNWETILTPATLSADRTVTFPDDTFTVGYRNLPAVGAKNTSYSLQTADVGKYVEVTSGGSITIPNSTFAAGDVIVIANNHTAAITITCSITDAYIAGTDTDKATVSLATRGIANIMFLSATRCIITGNVS